MELDTLKELQTKLTSTYTTDCKNLEQTKDNSLQNSAKGRML